MDVRGRGNSGISPDAMQYRLDVYVGDIVQVLATLRIKTAIFIGTSMGGVLTMLLAARAGDTITAALLNDIGPKTNSTGLSRIAGYIGKIGPFASWDALVEQVRPTLETAFPGRGDAFWRRYVGRAAREDAHGKVWLAYDPGSPSLSSSRRRKTGWVRSPCWPKNRFSSSAANSATSCYPRVSKRCVR